MASHFLTEIAYFIKFLVATSVAKSSGVCPLAFFASKSAPFAKKLSKTLVEPPEAA